MLELSDSEKKLIERYVRLRKIYILLMGFFLLLAFGQMFFLASRFIPIYMAPLERIHVPNLHEFIKSGFTSVARMNMFWVSLLESTLLGNFIAHSQISRVLKKLMESG